MNESKSQTGGGVTRTTETVTTTNSTVKCRIYIEEVQKVQVPRRKNNDFGYSVFVTETSTFGKGVVYEECGEPLHVKGLPLPHDARAGIVYEISITEVK